MAGNNHPQSGAQNQSELRFFAALILLALAFIFYGSAGMPFLGPDEPRYAEVAREMQASGDWITPRLAGIEWFEKPALTYWAAAAGYSIFGVSEFAARFGVGLMALGGSLLILLFGRRVGSPVFGYLAAAVLISSCLWIGLGRGATFDMPLAFTMELALVGFYLWMRDPRRVAGNPFFWLFSIGLGLAVLAKGLVGIILPLAIVGLYLLISRRLREVLRPAVLLPGACIFLVTAAVWYGPVIARHGRVFIDEFFIAHHFQRYLSNRYRHPQPVWFFVAIILAGIFPWSFFLISRIRRAFAGGWRTIVERRFDDLTLFLWLWVLVPLIFFSFSGSKLPGYILPVFPAVAMLIAQELERWWEDGPKSAWPIIATCLSFFATGIYVALGVPGTFGLEVFDAYRLATFMIMTSIVLLGIWFLISGRAAVLFLPFGFALIVLVLVNVFSPFLGETDSIKRIAQTAKASARPGERLLFFVNHDHGINFYATDLPLRDPKSEPITVFTAGDVEKFLADSETKSLLVLSPRRWIGDLEKSSRFSIAGIGDQRGAAKCSPGCDWMLIRVESKK